MPALERSLLHRLAELDADIRAAYQRFDFKAVWRAAFEFCAVDLSAFYLDIRKDSLYCDRPDEESRRAARTAMQAAFERIIAWLAPICVFTTEEAFLARYPGAKSSVHLQQFPQTPAMWRDEALAADWARLKDVRRVVTGALEVARRDKKIGASLEAAPTLHVADADLASLLKRHDLAELFITGAVTLATGEGPKDAFRLADVAGVAVEAKASSAEKCGRCWRYTGDVGASPAHKTLCARCADAVDHHDRSGKPA
jgi:isoleucyl-tRNA synthetase